MEDCYTVDFIRNAGLLGQLEDFISSKVTAALASLVSLLGSGTGQPSQPSGLGQKKALTATSQEQQ